MDIKVRIGAQATSAASAPDAHVLPLDARLAPDLYLARVEAGGVTDIVRFTAAR